MAIRLRKRTESNPFYYKGYDIPSQYFCDRRDETRKLTSLLTNGNNVVLKSPRRLGKSSLIWHVFGEEPFKGGYNTIYVDIYPTKTIDQFIAVFYKAILDCSTIRDKKGLDELDRRLKEVSITASFGGGKGIALGTSAQFETLRMERSLDAIFDLLGRTGRRNVVAIDEFQQIRSYRNDNIEASLRSYIQRCGNSQFIFSGSSRHMLSQIFDSPDKPFYRSCRSVSLETIPVDTYAEFCDEQFGKGRRSIDDDAMQLAYELFSGNTFCMQLTMNELFSLSAPGDNLTAGDVKYAIGNLVDEKSADYAALLHALKPDHENVLLCVANETLCQGVQSAAMRQKYGLPSPSSVASILAGMQDDRNRLVEEIVPGTFRLEDKFLELWVAKNVFGNLDDKYAAAGEFFKKERQLKSTTPKDLRQDKP